MNSGLTPSLHLFAIGTTRGIWQQRQSSSLIDSDSELSSDDEEGASNNSDIFSRNGTRRGSNIGQANNAVNINISGHQFAPAPIREPRDQRAREPAFTLSPAIATATTTKSIVEAIAVLIQYDYENGNPPFCM